MTDGPRLIEREWQSFLGAVGLRNAPAFQLREMRRAFFAGARAYSSIVMNGADAGDEPTPADMAMMEALEAELRGFLADVKAGRA